mmetsp:Transcript_8422/g.14099  ORF Transcript_8422/g.14099 Transcript_8422/m.14099 type:complete len:179 (-) Transcript_8422:293-829(-)
MRKNQLQKRSQDLQLSTLEYTSFHLEEQIIQFQLKNVLDLDSELDPYTRRNMEEIANLCILFNVQPSQKQGDLEDVIEDNVKKVLFEHEYLNTKLTKRSAKLKSELHPLLIRRKQLAKTLSDIHKKIQKDAKKSPASQHKNKEEPQDKENVNAHSNKVEKVGTSKVSVSEEERIRDLE